MALEQLPDWSDVSDFAFLLYLKFKFVFCIPLQFFNDLKHPSVDKSKNRRNLYADFLFTLGTH